MCGIAGYLRWDGGRASESIARSMADRLLHRGPDAGGVYVKNAVALTNRRLRIIDVAGPDQPLFNEDRSLAVVLNGEIYNYQDLRRDLIQKGHQLRTEGDTECLVHLYEEYGIEGCLERLNGMFSFALYDSRQEKVFLARDRLGIKPLFFYETHQEFLFASEPKAFLDHPAFVSRLNPRALLDALVLRYTPGHHSIFEGVQKLRPGQVWIGDLRSRESRVLTYWSPPFGEEVASGAPTAEGLKQSLEGFEQCLEDSVRRRLIAEVPLGTFLSGGIDSSLLVAEVARLSERKPLAITVGFGASKIDERPVARAIAEHLSLPAIEEEVSPQAASLLSDVAYYFDEPFFDSSALPTYQLCQVARKHVTVVLSGDGGDENFAGYRRYRFDAFENRVRSLVPGALRSPLFGTLAKLWPKGDYLPQKLRAKTLLSNLARDPLGAYLHSVSQMDRREALSLLNGDLRQELKGYETRDALEPLYNLSAGRDPLTRVLAFDFQTWLPDDILTKTDRASMAHSLEARVPLLDHELVSHAAGLPIQAKLNQGEGKFLLRQALGKRLPKALWDRPKHGFHAPVDEWLRGELNETLENAKRCPLLDSQVIDEAIQQHRSGRRNRSAALWSVVMLSQWYANFGEGKIPEPKTAPYMRRETETVS